MKTWYDLSCNSAKKAINLASKLVKLNRAPDLVEFLIQREGNIDKVKKKPLHQF